MTFRSLRLSTRLFLAFGVVVTLMTTSSAFAPWKLGATGANGEDIVTQTTENF